MRRSPHRVLALLVGGILLVAVAAVVVATLRPPPEFDTSTPEGTVQAYLRAVFQGDLEEAAEHLSPESGCDVGDLEHAYAENPGRVALVDTTLEDDQARVSVEVVYEDGDPFGGSEYSEPHLYRLVPDGQGWLLTGAPWPLYACEDQR